MDLFLDLGGAAEVDRTLNIFVSCPLRCGQGGRTDSRMLENPRIGSRLVANVIGGADRLWLGFRVVPAGLGHGFVSGLMPSPAVRA
jgi:hypothetical protein